ncbi:hypothetical protein [Candidatus Villigracilis affinis]
MAITLKLREEDGGLVVTFDDQTVKTAKIQRLTDYKPTRSRTDRF